jgi:hypothetical protein
MRIDRQERIMVGEDSEGEKNRGKSVSLSDIASGKEERVTARPNDR